MKLLRGASLALLCGLLAFTPEAASQGNAGQPAPDFPPGPFNDGQQHRLSDYQGKVVVLYFYESK